MTKQPGRSWRGKFHEAGRGAAWALRTQVNFRVHLVFAALVVAVAVRLRAEAWEWGLLGLCILGVLVAEVLNTSIEQLAKAITREHHPEIGRALDIAAGAVLISALGAALLGALLLLRRLLLWLGW